MTGRWIAARDRGAAGAVRLFCLAHAGGGGGFFRPWREALASHTAVTPIVLPGRETRRREPAYTSIERLLDPLCEAMIPFLDRPFALFGHSMGAIIAYEAARRLAAGGFGAPVRLFVSARRAPHLPARRPPLHALPDDQLIAQLDRLGGTDASLIREPALLRALLPCVRADFELEETYQPSPGDPLPTPISALVGERDPLVTAAEMRPWGRVTTAGLGLRVFDGGHFYLAGGRPDVLAAIRHDLERTEALAGPGETRDTARVTATPFRLERRPVAGVAGLTYHIAGHGDPPVVALNALGQGLSVWRPLLERLSRRRRVIVWEMRPIDTGGRPITFAEHCRDLHAILQQEAAGASHLVGWCTGAKLAARYCRAHPDAVRSMVFLSGSFKHPGRAPALDTAYERNLEAMCRAIARRPALAERLRSMFIAAGEDGASAAQDGDDLAASALASVPPELGPEVRRPFRDAAALAVYARQHTEFWLHDETGAGSAVTVPVLGIAGERDRVVSPAALRAALDHFPRARYAEIAGATHYCFYDRPDLVADLIEDFVAGAPPVRCPARVERDPAPKSGTAP